MTRASHYTFTRPSTLRPQPYFHDMKASCTPVCVRWARSVVTLKLHNGRVSLSDEYSRQRRWRAWNRIYSVLPDVRGKTILDLGCAIGDQAAELVARGASVIGIDANEELLRVARSRGIGNAEFRSGDLRDLDLALEADGIWCSFSVAYIANPQRHLMSWSQRLRPGGWMAVTEIDDLFGHEPLSDRAKSLIGAYETETLKTGRYDFRAGRKLQTYLEQAGLAIESVLVLPVAHEEWRLAT